MDFSQKKLTKTEWDSLEIPLPPNEMEVLRLIYNSYDDVNHSYNKNTSLVDVMKLTVDKKCVVHTFLFNKYFKESITDLNDKYEFDYDLKRITKSKYKIKTSDKIRIEHTDKRLDEYKDNIFEFELINQLESMVKSFTRESDNFLKYYYTLNTIRMSSISKINTIIMDIVDYALERYGGMIDVKKLVYNSYEFIEKNDVLVRYNDMRLYEHQRELFTIAKQPGSKIILYQAPTGTGKTMSPIGLAKAHKIIFVCAAKHVGLQLAKACIAMDIGLAIAFGCKDPGDIRLHYNAAKEIVRNYKTGGIFRVDNSVGDKVQVIVCDVQSYLSSMNYMCAFSKPEEIITYWDEPTISLDYDEHPFHDILQKNWKDNIIPNMVLSSATLPTEEQITPVVQDFRSKFTEQVCRVYNVVSHDCKKTIPIINKEGYCVLPHMVYTKKKDITNSVKHLMNYKTMLRHFDVQEITRFIKYVNDNDMITRDRYNIETYFESLDDIDVINIKLYYLDVLKHVAKRWGEHHDDFMKEHVEQRFLSTIKVTTSDAHTLTDGPTIFIADNVEFIAKYCLKIANIPTECMKSIEENIYYNQDVMKEIIKVEKDIQLLTETSALHDGGGDGSKRGPKAGVKKGGDVMRELQGKVKYLTSMIRMANLEERYIPNTRAHMKKHGIDVEYLKVSYKCDIHDSVVEKIMMTDVSPIWKMLLLLGIGVFTKFDDVTYLEIMKKLANEQKLFMIIASSDYIYGTNYQFCHGYISKDIIENMTQEKAIQSFGRIGRQNAQQDYTIRLRDNSLIHKVFQEEKDKKEVFNMNRLFG